MTMPKSSALINCFWGRAEGERRGSRETRERASRMIHLTSVWILTRRLHTGLGVVLIQRPLITVDGLTEGNRRDVSAQFSEGGPPWPPEGENYSMPRTICTYKSGTLCIFHLSAPLCYNGKVRKLSPLKTKQNPRRGQTSEFWGIAAGAADLEWYCRVGCQGDQSHWWFF